MTGIMYGCSDLSDLPKPDNGVMGRGGIFPRTSVFFLFLFEWGSNVGITNRRVGYDPHMPGQERSGRSSLRHARMYTEVSEFLLFEGGREGRIGIAFVLFGFWGDIQPASARGPAAQSDFSPARRDETSSGANQTGPDALVVFPDAPSPGFPEAGKAERPAGNHRGVCPPRLAPYGGHFDTVPPRHTSSAVFCG